MCSQREKAVINQVNRTIIALAGIVGALLDGFSSGDLLCIISMLVWLWQNEFSTIEEKWFDQCRQRLLVKK